MNVKYDFSDKTAVVTGAASGIGEGIALAFAESGASVAILDINMEKGQDNAPNNTGLAQQMRVVQVVASAVSSPGTAANGDRGRHTIGVSSSGNHDVGHLHGETADGGMDLSMRHEKHAVNQDAFILKGGKGMNVKYDFSGKTAVVTGAASGV